jgi:hypothetical protein
MTLTELLESLGDKLGIIEKESQSSNQSAAKIQTRAVTLTDLAAEIRSDEVQTLADKPSELSVPFEKIIEAAGIPGNARGWSIDRLRKLLLTDAFKGLSREEIQKRILGVLAGEHVEVESLVTDAIARDQALDAFERFARKKLDDRMAARQRQQAGLEEKIQSLEKECALLKSQMEADTQQWREWKKQKRIQERDLAWTVGFLVEKPVITTDEDD